MRRNIAGFLVGFLVVMANGGAGEPESYTITQGDILVADGVGDNPGGVLANDGGGIDVVGLGLIGEGTLELRENGIFVYTPPEQFFGEVTFTYEGTPTERTVLVPGDATWRYWVPVRDPANTHLDFHSSWMTLGYSENSFNWNDGTGLMGYGAIGDLSIDTGVTDNAGLTGYFRHEFESDGELTGLSIDLIRDDAAIIYLNGVEVARSSDDPSTFDQEPDSFTLAGPSTGTEDVVRTHDIASPLIEGTNILAISVHDQVFNSSDFGLHVRGLDAIKLLERSASQATITVADGEIPPLVRDDRYLVSGDGVFDSSQVFSLYLNDGVLSDTGVAFDPISEVVVSGDAAAMVAVDLVTGHFTFMPGAGFDDETSFSYQLRDKDGLSEPATVTLVRYQGAVVDLPTANPDEYSTTEASSVTVDAAGGVLANDLLATEALVSVPPENGRVTIELDGSFRYFPGTNFIGTDTFEYSAIRFRRTPLLDATTAWSWMHPLNGIDPARRVSDFNRNWQDLDHPTPDWRPGFGLMAYGDILGPDGSVPIDTFIGLPTSGERRTAYFRSIFSGVAGDHLMEVKLARDDGAIIYVNGEEIDRSVEPDSVTRFRFMTDRYSLMVPAGTGFWTALEEEGTINTHRIEGVALNDGANVIAISAHNTTSSGGAGSSDLGLLVESVEILEPLEATATVTVEVADGLRPPWLRSDSYDVVVGEVLDASGEMSLYANDNLFDSEGVAYDPITGAEHTLPALGQLLSFDDATGDFTFRSDSPGITMFTYLVEDKDGISPTTGFVTIRVRDTFELWRDRNFEAEAGEEVAGSQADPDGDFLSNQMEYALGLDPNVRSSEDWVEFEPTLGEWDRWLVRFRLASPVPADLSYVLEASLDLKNWVGVFGRTAGVGTTWDQLPGILDLGSPYPSLNLRVSEGGTFVEADVVQDDERPIYFRLRVTEEEEP